MAAGVNVRIETATKALLDDLKVHPRETCADVIDRLARQAIDDEPLTPRRRPTSPSPSKTSRPVGS